VSSSSRGNLPVPPDPLHRSADADERLQRWISAVVATPGLTAIKDLGEAFRLFILVFRDPDNVQLELSAPHAS